MQLLSQCSQLLTCLLTESGSCQISNNHHESTLPTPMNLAHSYLFHVPASHTFGYSCEIYFSLHNDLSIIQAWVSSFRGEREGGMWSPFPRDICATHQLSWNGLRQFPPPWLSRLFGANVALLWSLNGTVCKLFYWKALSHQKIEETLEGTKLPVLFPCTHKHGGVH